MSTISTLIAQARAFVTTLRSSIWAIDVRDGIGDSIQKLSEAIEQCYSDVSNPTLQTEALEAALQNKIDEGEMAALTIGDHTITAAKLAQGVIDNTLATSGAAADAAETGRQFGLIKADLGALTKPQRLADGTDLDTVLTPGVYMLYANNSYLHKPTADSEHGILEVLHEDFGDNTGRTFQRLTYTYKAGRTNIEIWVRTYSVLTSTWSVWISATEDLSRKLMLLMADLDALIAPPRLDDNTDLNSVIESGVYTLYATSSYLNKPTQDGEHGILEVWKENYGDTGRTFQRLTYTYKTGRTNSEIWVRSKSGIAGDAWSSWISVSNMSINDVGNLLRSQTGIILKVEGSYINLTTDPVSLTPVANAEWSHSVLSCAEGDTFIINADGGQRPRAWGFLDSGNHVLSVADASTVVEGLELTAPTNAVKLIINDKSGAVSYIPSAFLLTKIAESAQGKVDVQQSPSDYGKALIINRDGQVQPGVVSGGSGLTDNVKVALLACFRHVLWGDEHGNEYYNALEASLYAAETRLTAAIDYGNTTIFTDDPLSKVKWIMKVYYDGVEVIPRDYTLTGNLIAGQNVLAITYNDESTSIMVEAEEHTPQRITLQDGDLLKFNGWGMSSGADGHKPPYLVSNTTARVYYSAKGHAPYVDENNAFMDGIYPIPIPAFATHVRVSVAPNNYKIALNCWKYNNSTHNYTFISGTDAGFSVFHADVDVPQYPDNARALNIIIAKPDVSAITPSEEPTQVVVVFS